jgi:hypothetical protein
MNSTLNLTLNNDEKSIFYDNFFDERDQKSRIFEDIENDLKEKLIVSIIFHNYLKFRKK